MSLAAPKPAEGHVLDLFLKPRHVAIIGLSRSAVGGPVSVLTTLQDFGYAGRVSIINPSMAAESGANAYASLDDLPEPADLAVVSVARHLVLDVLKDCVRNRIPAALVITQGFADADETGRKMQDQMVALARETGLRILGPNTIGVANARDSFTSSFIELQKDDAPIGQIAQSGLFMMGHHIINNEPAGFSVAIDLGNACDIGPVEALDYFEQDDGIRVIQCHLEGIADGRAFLETAARVTRSKPIVALKAGRSKGGERAVASHTGAAAGETAVYRAAFEKAGVIEAETAEELRLFSKALVTYRPPRGRRVAVMTFSGGGAILSIDAVEGAGLSLATLSEETRTALCPLFPDWLEVDNPVDIWIPVSRDLHGSYPKILELLLRDPSVDAVICIYCSYRLPKYADFDCSAHIRRLAAAYPDKPILGWTYGLDISGFTRSVEADGNAVVFPSLESAAKTLDKLAQAGEVMSRDAAVPAPRLDADRAAVSARLTQAAEDQRDTLFVEGLRTLEDYGIPVSSWRFVESEDAAVAAAADMIAPFCLKVVADALSHKSDSGGIKLGLRDEAALRAAYADLQATVGKHNPSAAIAGVLVQEMAPKGHEVMIGAKRDPVFGPCIVAGAGGIYTEYLEDFAFRIAPLSETEARGMLAELRLARILAGVRGELPCDLDSLVDCLVRLSQMVCDHSEIAEIDINPLIVGPAGAVAVDARILLELGS